MTLRPTLSIGIIEGRPRGSETYYPLGRPLKEVLQLLFRHTLETSFASKTRFAYRMTLKERRQINNPPLLIKEIIHKKMKTWQEENPYFFHLSVIFSEKMQKKGISPTQMHLFQPESWHLQLHYRQSLHVP